VPIKNRQQFLTIITLTAVGLLAMDRIIGPPLMKLWNDRSARIEALKGKVKDGHAMQIRKESFRQRWAEIQTSSLTNDITAAQQQLFSGLNRWTSYSGVSIDSISPTPKQGNDPSYKTVECRVDLSGSIDRLSRFLYSLETDPMALKVQSIEFTSKDATGNTIGMGVQVSALILTGLDPNARK
jgi:hypothetical protein